MGIHHLDQACPRPPLDPLDRAQLGLPEDVHAGYARDAHRSHEESLEVHVDTSYYGGMLDKAHEDFYRYICMYPALAYFCYCTWCRMKDNDKDNFMAKWRVPKDEE